MRFLIVAFHLIVSFSHLAYSYSFECWYGKQTGEGQQFNEKNFKKVTQKLLKRVQITKLTQL